MARVKDAALHELAYIRAADLWVLDCWADGLGERRKVKAYVRK